MFVAGIGEQRSKANEIEFKYMQLSKPNTKTYKAVYKTYRERIPDTYRFGSIDG